ncbi:MAG: glycosyltransferase WbsX family protein [Thermoleophilia bacterium]|nr:glycosyltransferase WbsX family protein [Thermoleophilia bacterium]
MLEFPGENQVPRTLRDRRIIAEADAWRARRGGRPAREDQPRPEFSEGAASLSERQGGLSTDLSATDQRHQPQAKLIAFYLPQFHPIPENDEWWGEGFTEWTNVRRAKPLYRDHFQPQLPSELGFYDLRDHQVLDVQAALAREYGIHGFCYYYYWFNGRRVLERPLDHILSSGKPHMPFCLCWANENWTRRWDGRENDVLLRQDYTGDWADRLIRDLLPALADERYMTINGAAALLVYRADVIPEGARVTDRWRRIARSEAGLDLHLAAVQSHGLTDPVPYGFDAAVEFPPHNIHVPANPRRVRDLDPRFDGILGDYRGLMRARLALPLPQYVWYRGVIPSWDNTARRGTSAHLLVTSSPYEYRLWLRKTVLQALARAPAQEPLVFINAWNEWGEGTHLEPDDRYGRQWLEATRGALIDGIRQYLASEGIIMNEAQALEYVAASMPAP